MIPPRLLLVLSFLAARHHAAIPPAPCPVDRLPTTMPRVYLGIMDLEAKRLDDSIARLREQTRSYAQAVIGTFAATGEFSGLARFAPEGAAALRAVWHEALARGLDAPFGAAATLRQAYLSDGLNAVAARGVALGAVLVDGGWREIDTEQDLASAEKVVDVWRS